MNFECSLDRLIEARKIEVFYTRQFIWHITFPIIGGFMFGYNTGVISGALISINNYFSIIQQQIIVGALVFVAFLSSLLTGYLSNRFGRKKVMILSCVFFIIGSPIMISKTFSSLVLGRAVVGIGVGMSSTCCPIYIAEMTPKLIRGRIIAFYQVGITFGMFIASLMNLSFGDWKDEPWRYSLAFATLPALLEFFGLFTISESYRWLLSKNRIDEAKDVIVKLNQMPITDINDFADNIVQANDIIEQHLQEHSIYQKISINKVFIDEVARKSLIFGCSLQFLGQIVGINTIMYYTATVIQMSNEQGQNILWLSSLVALFNFLLSFVGVILIDKIGRRKLLLISLLGIFFSLVILSLTFQVIFVRCTEGNYTWLNSSNNNFNSIQFQNQSDIDIVPNMCPSDYLWIIITGMIFYIVSYTIGMGPIPWIVTSEIYPIWCRSFNMSLSTATNWLINLIITFTFPTLVDYIHKYGTFWLYSLFTFCGIVLVYKYLPETQKVALEEIPTILSD